jgi:hypothetical protein
VKEDEDGSRGYYTEEDKDLQNSDDGHEEDDAGEVEGH